jgi:ribosomal protein S18 acetylase RimI-like enzyme
VGFTIKTPSGFALARLDPSVHDRNQFNCGQQALDHYLATQAAQDQSKDLSATHVLVREGELTAVNLARVAGYVTLASAQVPLVDAPKQVTKQTNRGSVPSLLLARMAVDVEFQRLRLGKCLLDVAFRTACEMADMSGCMLMTVDAKDEHVQGFYTKHGFVSFVDRPLRLYVMTATIRKALAISGRSLTGGA